MPSKKDLSAPADPPKPTKRKPPPQSTSNSQGTNGGRGVKRVKMIDARSILTQKTDAALKNGELDLDSFLKARKFEIKALEDGMQRSKASRTQRAFQQVPRNLRRRTASHNVKKVPKWLHNRAAREMKEDNTPTVDSSKRKPGSSRSRIRAETAKRLGILATKKRAQKSGGNTQGVETRAARPKIRRNLLNDPPKPISKFRKRQIHKTWLPTHMWLAKRARMTEPKIPLWRFAIPTTSTEKSYRPTHRAGGARGAVAWDMSYMSTIGLEGPIQSLEKVLKAVGAMESRLWETKGGKWISGKRSWNGWLMRETKDEPAQIGPATVIWCSAGQDPTDEADDKSKKRPLRRVFVRVHPSSFLETWNELLRLSILQRPTVHVEDLRFEIGSINITGPGSTEALLGILHPFCESDGTQEKYAQTFSSLVGVTNPSSLPANSVLAFSILDPRLRYPPRAVKPPKSEDEEASFALLQMLSTWPVDGFKPSTALFDRNARFKATRLPAQKSINRRKSQAHPGDYPSLVSTDPPIPIMLFTSRSASGSAQGTWTLLTPWKCILPIWYGLMHFPLSSGGNPRFGGLDELRQIHFEQGAPYFPADYPGTDAGFAWESEERKKRKAEWDQRPKGKRIEWDTLDLGAGRKGEVGKGWACDFERLFGIATASDGSNTTSTTQDAKALSEAQAGSKIMASPVPHLTSKAFTNLLSSPKSPLQQTSAIATVRITLVTRGIASPCARIYRLPRTSASAESSTISSPPATTREEWMSLLPAATDSKRLPNPQSKAAKGHSRIPLDTPVPQRIRLLARSLLQNPPLKYPADKDDGHPLVPGEEDLIGFVTTGEFNLAEGKGVAVGSVAVAKVLEGLRIDSKRAAKEGRFCIVRNAGEKIGRLARWEVV